MITTMIWLAGISLAAVAVIAFTRTISSNNELCMAESRPRYQRSDSHHVMEAEELIDEAGAESFPASDPPARSPVIGIGRRD